MTIWNVVEIDDYRKINWEYLYVGKLPKPNHTGVAYMEVSDDGLVHIGIK